MASHIKLPTRPKSSPDARKLLAAVYGQEGSWPKVARRLKLSSAAAAWKMAHGQLRDTDEMKAVLRIARRRRERAFAGMRMDANGGNVQAELVSMALNDLKAVERKLRSLLPEEQHE